ncbi:MAG: hypothetical protein FJ291_05095 [Planctomycetes bacterium]|nr:hypothetical protein [Planctomycetota bacterium]
MAIIETLSWFLACLILSVVLFLLIRQGVLWYWKVDRVVELLEAISNSLYYIAKKEKEAAGRPQGTTGKHEDGRTFCPGCGKKFPEDMSGKSCPDCGAVIV